MAGNSSGEGEMHGGSQMSTGARRRGLALDGSRDGSSPQSASGESGERGEWGAWAERQVRGQREGRWGEERVPAPSLFFPGRCRGWVREQQETVSRGVTGKVTGEKPAFWKLEK